MFISKLAPGRGRARKGTGTGVHALGTWGYLCPISKVAGVALAGEVSIYSTASIARARAGEVSVRLGRTTTCEMDPTLPCKEVRSRMTSETMTAINNHHVRSRLSTLVERPLEYVDVDVSPGPSNRYSRKDNVPILTQARMHHFSFFQKLSLLPPHPSSKTTRTSDD